MKKMRFAGFAALVLVWLALCVAAWTSPAEDISVSERRKLARFPELNAQTLLGGSFMEKFEDYTLDQFPLRDPFRRLKARVHYSLLGQKDNHDIYIAEGQAAKLEYPMNSASVSAAVDRFNAIYETYLKGSNAVVSVVPDKGYYLAEQNGCPAMDYEALFDAVREGTPWAEYVDLTDCLSSSHYYFTDTHWRQEKITDAAVKLCEALESGSFADDDLTLWEVERPFYGVYYGQAALPMEPDVMYVLEHEILKDCTVYNHETGETAAVYDETKLDSNDLYDIFLSGAAALLTVENPHGQPGRELIVFRDSFGSSMVPLLLKDYAAVTVVDIRYIAPELLGDYIDFHGQDVLMLYSTLVLNSGSLK